MLSNPAELIGWMLLAVLIGFAVCSLGLQKGVERITKFMMATLFLVMIALCIRSVTLAGRRSGHRVLPRPRFLTTVRGDDARRADGDVRQRHLRAAMGQAFFTLSLGISAMEIFGSYIGKRSLTGEASPHRGFNTLVAILAGLIIFPCVLRLRR